MAFNAEMYRRLRELGVDNDSAVQLANGLPLTETTQTPVGAYTSGPTNLNVTAGLPYTRVVRLTNGKTTWAMLSLFEVRMEVRETDYASPLIKDLRPYITKAYDDNDVVITLAMSGANTRPLRSGNYDMIISDADTTDVRAQRLLYGSFDVTHTISDMTSAESF